MEKGLIYFLVIHEIESQILEIFDAGFRKLAFWLS